MKLARARMMKISVQFKPGYVAAVEAISTEQDGILKMDGNAYAELYRELYIEQPIKGAGGVVHAALGPLVAVVDQVAGTHISTCAGCQARAMDLDALTRSK